MKYLFSLLAIMIITAGAIQAQKTKNGGKMLRHVVLFKFKESSSAEDIKKVEDCVSGTAFKNKRGEVL